MAEINQDTEFRFRPRTSKEDSISNIAKSRVQRNTDVDSFRKGAEERKYTDELAKQIKYLEDIEKRSIAQEKMLANAKKLQQDINDLMKSRFLDYNELLGKNKEVVEINKKILDDEFNSKIKELHLIKDREEREAKINALQSTRNDILNDYNALLEDTNEKQKTLEDSNKSMIDSFSNNMSKLKTEIRDLAVIKGVGDITSGLFGNGNTSMLSAYNNTRSQLGVSSSEFNQFKNSLFTQLKDTGNLFEFGWKDTAEYMAKLGELNITSQEMAEQQYLAVIQGSRYLGLQTETQAKILKVARNTGNMDLLNQTNETLVQIMNAQLGVSKEQLDQMANNAVEVADIVTFLGGDGSDAFQRLLKIEAAVTKEYGQSTTSAAENILKSILANPSSNQYLNSGFFGEDYFNILSYAQNGQTDKAFKLIIDSIKNSKSTQVAGNNLFALEALGADQNVMAIANSSGNMNNVDKNLADINSSSKDITEIIRDFNKSWSDKLINFGSNFLSLLPFNEFITLQNAYYAVAMIEMLVKMPGKMTTIIGLLNQIAISSAIGANGITGNNPMSITNLLNNKVVAGMAALSLAVVGTTMAINDAKQAVSKSKEWGTSKTAAAIGGFIGGTDENKFARVLKNAAKYAAIGAAIGIIVPGVGNLVGAVVGGLIGLAIGAGTGAVGGQNIARGLDSVAGKPNTDSSGAANAPVVSAPRSSFGGRGAPIGRADFPWTLTSPFGYRGVLQTSAGPTNPFHSGIDLAHPDGTPIGANNAGTVSSAGTANDGANYVIVNSGDGYEQIYWHLNRPSHLKRGDHVNEGQLIGYMGMTGHATGPHLHFGLRHAGTSNYIDPINSMNEGVFYPSENGYTSAELKLNEEGQRLLEKSISADTLSDQAASVAYNGIGDGENIVAAVNSGFAGLNNKLEELSSRQDNQEQVLRRLTSRQSSKAYQM